MTLIKRVGLRELLCGDFFKHEYPVVRPLPARHIHSGNPAAETRQQERTNTRETFSQECKIRKKVQFWEITLFGVCFYSFNIINALQLKNN